MQRVSAVLIVLLLQLHILSFSLLQKSAGGAGYILIEAVQIVFYAALMGHIALSFGNARHYGLALRYKKETNPRLLHTRRLCNAIYSS